MRQLRIPFAIAGLSIGLSGCMIGPAALLDWAGSNFSHVGTSVVCLGADQAVTADEDGAYRILGTVLREQSSQNNIGNVDSCWGAPSRVLTVEDEAGVIWKVGYRWQSHSMGDSTPQVQVSPGEAIDLLYRPGDLRGSAGFAVHHEEDGLIYAMESGRGSAGLQVQDIPELTVERGETVGTEDLECGQIQAQTIVFVSQTGDEAEVGPGEDTPMEVSDDPGLSTKLTLCNINAVEIPASCEEPAQAQSEHSWVLFNPR